MEGGSLIPGQDQRLRQRAVILSTIGELLSFFLNFLAHFPPSQLFERTERL